MRENFPWYDSRWLSQFVRARTFVASNYPAQLEEFTRAFAKLRTRPEFRPMLLNSVFTENQVGLIQAAYREIRQEHLELDELASHGRFVVHDHPSLVGLHSDMAAAIGQLVGERLEPAYTFFGLYNRNGRCEVHLDAPIAKWTLDYCIDQSEPWPISFSRVVPWPEVFDVAAGEWADRIKSAGDLGFSSYSLRPGQAVLFSGSSQWHFREPMTTPDSRAYCDLLFLHFTPAGTRRLSDWRNWEPDFGLEGLTAAMDTPAP